MLKSLIRKWDYLTIAMSTSRQDLIEKYHNCYGAEYGKNLLNIILLKLFFMVIKIKINMIHIGQMNYMEC